MQMTDEEIDQLKAGPEFDALVAENVMGWIKEGPYLGSLFWITTEGNMHPRTDAWCPSSDIAAAWEVVEQLRKLEPRGDAKFGIKGRSPEIVVVWQGTNFYCKIDGQGIFREFHGEGDTAQLAICRAALKAVNRG